MYVKKTKKINDSNWWLWLTPRSVQNKRNCSCTCSVSEMTTKMNGNSLIYLHLKALATALLCPKYLFFQCAAKDEADVTNVPLLCVCVCVCVCCYRLCTQNHPCLVFSRWLCAQCHCLLMRHVTQPPIVVGDKKNKLQWSSSFLVMCSVIPICNYRIYT